MKILCRVGWHRFRWKGGFGAPGGGSCCKLLCSRCGKNWMTR